MGAPNHIDLQQQPCNVTFYCFLGFILKSKEQRRCWPLAQEEIWATTSPAALPKATGTSELSLKCMAGAGSGSASKDGHLQERGPGEDRRLEADGARQHYSVCFTPKPISYLLHCTVSAPPRPWSKSSRVSPHLGCSLKQPPSCRYPSRFLHQWLGRMSGCASQAWLVSLWTALRASAFVR